MSQFQKIVGNFVVASIMVLCLLSFFITIQEENNAEDPLKNDKDFNQSFTGLISAIDNSTSDSQEKYGVFSSEDPQAGFGSIVLFAIVSVGKAFSSMVFSMFTAIIKLPLVIFGIPPNVYSLILTWLIISVIVSVWLLYKLGG